MEFQTKSDLAYERIRQAILDGSIPIGAKLTVTNLVDQYGMSPMPIREALTKLAQDGLVQSTPHHGARVAEFNYYDHLESSLIRSALEKQLFQAALQFWDDIRLDALEECYNQLYTFLDQGNISEFSRLRRNFFQIIYRVIPLDGLKQLVENYNNRYQIFHYFVVKIAEEDGLDRTWELLSELKSLLHALQNRKFEVCTALFNQILLNDYLVFSRYLMNSLDKEELLGDSEYDFLWSLEKLTPEKRSEIRKNIEMFIKLRMNNISAN